MAKRNYKKELLQYIRDNNEWTDAQVERAWEIIDECRCPIDQADKSIAWDIRQMLEDYASDNDLDCEFWEKYFVDEDDVWWSL